MQILIIGSKGFIGQHLLCHFKETGHDVFGADVVVDYMNTERYVLIHESSSDYSFLFQRLTYDLCINCSGAASVQDSLNNPMKDFYLNTIIVFKILEAIKTFQPNCRFINLSSAAVYGNPEHLPVKESARLKPLSPYGIHKLQSEHICKEFYDFYQIQTCSIRIFSVYGPGLKKQLFWDIFEKAKSCKAFKLYGTGNESRDFIYVHDLARAIELVAKFSNFKADIINIANGKEIKIKDAVSIFFSFFNCRITYNFSGESRKGDPIRWVADIDKLKSFGYIPSVDLRSGLQQYFEWVKVNKKI
jgi:UDP-glucose 4-epimerase